MATETREAFPIDAAQIVGLFMESVFLVTFFSCVRILIFPENTLKPLHEINFKMLIAALLMFVFGTMDVSFGFTHNYNAFITHKGDPIEVFSDTSHWINVMKMVCYVSQTFVGDSILLYRCWIVYNRRYLIVLFPIIVWLAGSASGALTIWAEATLDNNSADSLLNANRIEPFITSMLSLTLAVNIITTSMIVWRIHAVRRPLKHRSALALNDGPLANVLRVLIESGLMYTMSIVILFVLYMANNNGQFGVSDSVVQIIGITFNLIITRVDRGRATQFPSSNYRSQIGFAPAQVFSPGGNPPGSASGNVVPLHMINIQTTISRYPPDEPDMQIGEAKLYESEDSEARDVEHKKSLRISAPQAV